MAGDPVSGHRWLRRSLAKVRQALLEGGYRLCCETIRRLLRKHKISPKSNVRRLTPNPSPDRNRQFTYIQGQRQAFERLGWPVISVDTKKRELIGLFHNAGQVWCAKGTEVYMHDFARDARGKAIPYGIYDVHHNTGHVYVGKSADTAEFAVDAIAQWWKHIGSKRFPDASDLLILADCGGSNGYRVWLWKHQLQTQLADAFDIAVTVAHYPTGASKWNPIEHRLFSQISQTWAGTPLTSFELALEGIRNTRTQTGLQVEATLIEKHYATGLKVGKADRDALDLEPHAVCPKWNYTIYPRKQGTCF